MITILAYCISVVLSTETVACSHQEKALFVAQPQYAFDDVFGGLSPLPLARDVLSEEDGCAAHQQGLRSPCVPSDGIEGVSSTSARRRAQAQQLPGELIEQATKFQCLTCKTSYTRRDSLLRHMYRKHPVADHVAYVCLLCRKPFNTQYQLKRHTRTHDSSQRRHCPYSDCEKTFVEQVSLTRHLLIHTKKYPYPCALCGKQFRVLYNLKRHMKTIHHPLILL